MKQPLSASQKTGYLYSLSAIPSWILCFILFLGFCGIFSVERDIDLAHWFLVPALLTSASLVANYFDLAGRLKIRPYLITYVFVSLHGFWALYLGFSLQDEFNGYFCIFLFAIGLKLLDPGLNFRWTIIFSLFVISVYALWQYYFENQIGSDDLIFVFFVGFNGFFSAFINELNFRKRKKLMT